MLYRSQKNLILIPSTATVFLASTLVHVANNYMRISRLAEVTIQQLSHC